MKRSYFDVIVLGTDTGSLLTAALLARRGFRILLLGQGDVAPTYRIGPFCLPRRQEHLLGAASPTMGRVLDELNLRQSYRRHSAPREPGFQVAMPHHRLDLHRDSRRLSRELEREFQQLHRPLLDFHRNLQQQAERLDTLLVGQTLLPPGTLLERHRFGRAIRHLGFTQTSTWPDPLADFPDDHPFRQIRMAPAQFAWGGLQRNYDQLAVNRQYVNHHLRAVHLPNQAAGLRAMLLESIRYHGGVLMLDEGADALRVERGRVHGLRLQSSGDELSAAYVAAGIHVEALAPLLPNRKWLEPLYDRIGEPQHSGYRYLLNLVVMRQGIPAGLGRVVYFLGEQQVRTQRPLPLRMKRYSLDDAHELLSFEALINIDQLGQDSSEASALRTRVWSRVQQLLPFIAEFAVIQDSPHDGLPPTMSESCHRHSVELGRRGSHTLPRTYTFPLTSTLSIAALPVRTPIKRLLLCGEQVLPGLGPEGELLAAWGAAQLIARGEQSREWTRRRQWAQLG